MQDLSMENKKKHVFYTEQLSELYQILKVL